MAPSRNWTVRVVDKDASGNDLAYWLSKSPEERVAAVEFLRTQCFLAQGLSELPRLERVVSFRNWHP